MSLEQQARGRLVLSFLNQQRELRELRFRLLNLLLPPLHLSFSHRTGAARLGHGVQAAKQQHAGYHPSHGSRSSGAWHGSEMRSAAANGMGANFVAVFADFPKLFLPLMS